METLFSFNIFFFLRCVSLRTYTHINTHTRTRKTSTCRANGRYVTPVPAVMYLRSFNITSNRDVIGFLMFVKTTPGYTGYCWCVIDCYIHRLYNYFYSFIFILVFFCVFIIHKHTHTTFFDFFLNVCFISTFLYTNRMYLLKKFCNDDEEWKFQSKG